MKHTCQHRSSSSSCWTSSSDDAPLLSAHVAKAVMSRGEAIGEFEAKPQQDEPRSAESGIGNPCRHHFCLKIMITSDVNALVKTCPRILCFSSRALLCVPVNAGFSGGQIHFTFLQKIASHFMSTAWPATGCCRQPHCIASSPVIQHRRLHCHTRRSGRNTCSMQAVVSQFGPVLSQGDPGALDDAKVAAHPVR